MSAAKDKHNVVVIEKIMNNDISLRNNFLCNSGDEMRDNQELLRNLRHLHIERNENL